MIILDRNSEPRNCPLCKTNYNETTCRPEALIPCGHTFCSRCVRKFERVCKMCATGYNQIIPDYEMIDLIRQTSKKLQLSNGDSTTTLDDAEEANETQLSASQTVRFRL